MKLLLPAFLFSALCFSQAAQQPTEVPVENEPHHHLVFENEYVRVFKVEVPPHEATLVHRHKRDYVVVTIGDAEVTNAVVGKEPKKWSFKDGDVTFLEATGEKSFAHKAVNESDKWFYNYTVELKLPVDINDNDEGQSANESRRDFRGYLIIARTHTIEKWRPPKNGAAIGFNDQGFGHPEECWRSWGKSLLITVSKTFVLDQDSVGIPASATNKEIVPEAGFKWLSKESRLCTDDSVGSKKIVEIRKNHW